MKAQILLFFFLLFFTVAYSQQHKIDSLQNLLKSAKDDTNKVNILNKLGQKSNQSGNLDSALTFAMKAQALAEKILFKKGVADALLNMGYIYMYREKDSIAAEYSLRALAIYQGMANKKGIANSLSRIGYAYEHQCNYSKALDNMFKALAIEEEIGDEAGGAINLGNIGDIYYYEGNYVEALKYEFKALSASEKVGDEKGVASILSPIGAIYYAQGNYSKTLEYMFKGLDMDQKIGDKNGSAYTLCNIGEIYRDIGNYTKALEYDFKALSLFQETGGKKGSANSLLNIGSVYNIQGNLSAAVESDYKALALFREMGYERGISYCYKELGSIATQKKDYKQAKIYLDSTLLISKNIGEKEMIATAYLGLSQFDSSMGDNKTALEDYKKYFIFHDSIINESNEKRIIQTETNYEFEQKQAAEKAAQDKKDAARDADEAKHKAESNIQKVLIGFIASIAVMLILLVVLIFQRMKGVEKGKLIAEQQKSWLELKALRTQMNPHFLYNTINSIQSFILKNDTRSSSNYLSQFASLMRGVLENSRKDKITLTEEVEELSNYLDFEAMRFPAKFNFHIKVDDKLDKTKTFLPPLLIQPFVENAIWHGLMHMKEGEGKLIITFEGFDDHIKCTVDDNGVGRKASAEMKKSSVHKSVGLSIVAERIESMNKMYHWDMKAEIIDRYNEDGSPAGTRVELILPLIFNTVDYA